MIFWASTNFVGMYGVIQKYIGILETMVHSPTPEEFRDFLLPIEMRQNMAIFVAAFAVQECKHLKLEISGQNAYSMKVNLEKGHPCFCQRNLAPLCR